jgi:hypothetical protein
VHHIYVDIISDRPKRLKRFESFKKKFAFEGVNSVIETIPFFKAGCFIKIRLLLLISAGIANETF